MKTFGAFGEAGFVTTNSQKKSQIIRSLLHAGIPKKQNKNMINEADYISLNHKPDEVQASFLNISIQYLNEKLKKLEKVTKIYNSELRNLCKLQKNFSKKSIHGKYLYMPRFRKREKLISFLNTKHIETKVYYTPLLSNSKPFLDQKSKFINASLFSNEILALPFFSNISENQLNHVITNIKKFYKHN
jgi:dTDP-4-amino-4,6-dideoxygalactose transaminase